VTCRRSGRLLADVNGQRPRFRPNPKTVSTGLRLSISLGPDYRLHQVLWRLPMATSTTVRATRPGRTPAQAPSPTALDRAGAPPRSQGPVRLELAEEHRPGLWRPGLAPGDRALCLWRPRSPGWRITKQRPPFGVAVSQSAGPAAAPVGQMSSRRQGGQADPAGRLSRPHNSPSPKNSSLLANVEPSAAMHNLLSLANFRESQLSPPRSLRQAGGPAGTSQRARNAVSQWLGPNRACRMHRGSFSWIGTVSDPAATV